MKPPRTSLPKLETLGRQAVPTPIGGPGNGFISIAGLYFRKAEEEGLAAKEGLALQGGPGPFLGEPWARSEISIRLLTGNPRHLTLNTYLMQECRPPEAHGRIGVVGQVFTLRGEGIGKEDETGLVKAFEEQHAGMGPLVFVGGSEDKSVVVFRVCVLGLGEERFEACEGGRKRGRSHVSNIVEILRWKQVAMQKRVSSFLCIG